jgi:hypothetical protein
VPSGFGSVAWISTFRVATSTTESIAEILATNRASDPDASCDLTWTAAPFRRRLTSCCGTEKFTWIGSIDSSETIFSPAARYWPRFARRMPRIPEKGARIVFRAIVARISPTRAVPSVCSASARS